jgi:hypothetical protein
MAREVKSILGVLSKSEVTNNENLKIRTLRVLSLMDESRSEDLDSEYSDRPRSEGNNGKSAEND